MNDVVTTVTRVLVVDDHAPYRASISSLLSLYDEFSVVGEVASVDEALSHLELHFADLVLLDVHMVGIDGIAGAGIILRRFPNVHVLLCSTSSREAIAAPPDSDRCQFVSKADLDPETLLRWRQNWD